MGCKYVRISMHPETYSIATIHCVVGGKRGGGRFTAVGALELWRWSWWGGGGGGGMIQ